MAEASVERWTATRLATITPKEGVRYEIVDGELFVHAPGNKHQIVGNLCAYWLTDWNARTGLGVVIPGPGLLLGEYDDVIPDVIWVSHARRKRFEQADDKLHGAPELVVEVLSPGRANERRDREVKLRLYARIDVLEYWIVDPVATRVDVFRRRGDQLVLAASLGEGESLTSPLLPGFALPVAKLFQP